MPSSTNPTQGNNNDNWFNPIPIDDYYKINEQARQNVPTSPPNDETLGNYTISCGPILRLAGTWENNNDTTEDPNYRGSILLVIKKILMVLLRMKQDQLLLIKLVLHHHQLRLLWPSFLLVNFLGQNFIKKMIIHFIDIQLN